MSLFVHVSSRSSSPPPLAVPGPRSAPQHSPGISWIAHSQQCSLPADNPEDGNLHQDESLGGAAGAETGEPTGPAGQTPGADPKHKVSSVGVVFDLCPGALSLFLAAPQTQLFTINPFLNTEDSTHIPPAQPSSVNMPIYRYFPVASQNVGVSWLLSDPWDYVPFPCQI